MRNKFNNTDEYIALQSGPAGIMLQELRKIIQSTVPEATETISYQMPAFKYHGMLAWYAASRNHCGLYILPEVIKEFKDRLKEYKTSKSAIRFPFSKPLPEKLLEEIIYYAAHENLSRHLVKQERKKI